MKKYDEANKVDTYDFTISCQEKVLTWIILSFVNYYGFILLTLIIIKFQGETSSILTKRFKIGVFMTFILVPFMLSWNLYGNFMIKNEYFTYKQTQTKNMTNSTEPGVIEPTEPIIIP